MPIYTFSQIGIKICPNPGGELWRGLRSPLPQEITDGTHKGMIQCFKVRMQYFKGRMQYFKDRIQYFKAYILKIKKFAKSAFKFPGLPLLGCMFHGWVTTF